MNGVTQNRKGAKKGWETIPLRYVCHLNPSIAFNEFEEDDDLTFLPMDRVKNGYFIQNTDKFSKFASSYNVFEEGDIILAKVTPCFENGNIAIAKNLVGGKGFGSSELFVIRPTKVERRFLFYYFQSSAFKQEGEASMTGAGGLKRVSPDLLRQHYLPCPAKEIQRLVSDYLDRETTHIDALVAEKEKMLALLEEKRAARISLAVTRGLNPDAPLKPSGLDWLGDVPAHWEVYRLKFLINYMDQGSSPQCYNYPAEAGQWGVLKTGCVNGGVFREFENKALPDEIASFGASEVQINDVLMSRASGSVDLIGSVAYVSQQPTARLLLSDKIYRFRIKLDVVDPGFMVYAMGADYLRYQIKMSISGAEGLANNIAKSDIIEFSVITPSLQEQAKISTYINNATIANSTLSRALTISISLLKEHRAALITAAVTGQIPIKEMRK